MMNYKFMINIEILINKNLHNKRLIDEETYLIVNDKLLKKLNK